MGRPPAFQLYVKDWLTSKKRATMSLDQQAAYMNLLCHCWDTDDCSLPDDPTILAALSELREHWNTRSTPVQQAFVPHPKKPGFLTNMRLYAEHHKYLQIQKERRRAGLESGASRRKSRVNTTEHVFNKGSAPVKQMSNSSIPSSSSLKELKKEGVLIHTMGKPLSSAKPSPKKRLAPIPLSEGFMISDNLWDWAIKKRYSREWVEREFEKFCDRNRATGQQYIDWEAAFRNWLLKAEEFAASRNSQTSRLTHSHTLNRRERIPV